MAKNIVIALTVQAVVLAAIFPIGVYNYMGKLLPLVHALIVIAIAVQMCMVKPLIYRLIISFVLLAFILAIVHISSFINGDIGIFEPSSAVIILFSIYIFIPSAIYFSVSLVVFRFLSTR